MFQFHELVWQRPRGSYNAKRKKLSGKVLGERESFGHWSRRFSSRNEMLNLIDKLSMFKFIIIEIV